MAIRDDGNGPYVVREDGTKDYGQLMNFSFSMNDEPVVEFNPEQGILMLSMSLEDCEALSRMFVIRKDCPSAIVVPGMLPGMPSELRFEGVTQIVSLAPGESGYHLSIGSEEKPA